MLNPVKRCLILFYHTRHTFFITLEKILFELKNGDILSNISIKICESAHEILELIRYVSRGGSDGPGKLHSLIRAFTACAHKIGM